MRRKLIITLLLGIVFFTGIGASVLLGYDFDTTELEKEEMQDTIWNTYYNSDWSNMPAKSYKSYEQYYTTVFGIDSLDYEYVFSTMAETNAGWNSEPDFRHSHLMIAIINAFKEKGRPALSGTITEKDKLWYDNDKAHIRYYFEPDYQFKETKNKYRVRTESIVYLYNYIMSAVERYNQVCVSAKNTNFGEINLQNNDENLPIFLQGIIYGDGFWNYCINYEGKDEDGNKIYGREYTEDLAKEYYNDHEEEIKVKYNDFAERVTEVYKSYKIHYKN